MVMMCQPLHDCVQAVERLDETPAMRILLTPQGEPLKQERVESLAELHADGEAMPINVIQPDGDYWPIPWYLRRFSRVGYWHELPEHPDAAIVIAAPRLREELDRQLDNDYAVETLGLRPAILRMMYIDEELWKAYLDTLEE